MSTAVTLGLTEAGIRLRSKIKLGDGGTNLIITRIVAGAGRSDEPLKLAEVIDARQEFVITGREMQDGRVTISTLLNNFELETGYSMWQIGIYALDPDDGEVLDRITQFDEPRRVPARYEAGWTYTPDFNFTTHNASEVTVVINPAGLVTQEQLLVLHTQIQEALEVGRNAEAAAQEAQAAAQEGGVVFSQTRPTGDWTLWLHDLGEIPGYPEDTQVPITMDTAPLDAPGDFAVMYNDGSGETVLNMTDNPETAGDDDIVIVED